MEIFLVTRRSLFLWIWVFSLPLIGYTADSGPGLTVRETGAYLYSRQDIESDRIASLQKGEALLPLAEAVGIGTWYLVKTQKGLTGWVRGADVTLSDQVKDTFRAHLESTWSARTSGGRAFEGTWSVEPGPTADKVSGTWTLQDDTGKIALRGAWSAQKFSTGWSGVWRAVAAGQKGEHAGSWTADFPQAREGRFAELFEAAARDAIRGVWIAGNNSGSWSIRATN
jgi:hypothetical protein